MLTYSSYAALALAKLASACSLVVLAVDNLAFSSSKREEIADNSLVALSKLALLSATALSALLFALLRSFSLAVNLSKLDLAALN